MQDTYTFYRNKDCCACEYEASKRRSWVDIAESSLSPLFVIAYLLFLVIYRPTGEEIKLYGNIIIRFADNHGGKMLIATLCYVAIRNIDLSPPGVSIAHTCIGRASNILYSGVGTTDSATRDYVKQNKEDSSNE